MYAVLHMQAETHSQGLTLTLCRTTNILPSHFPPENLSFWHIMLFTRIIRHVSRCRCVIFIKLYVSGPKRCTPDVCCSMSGRKSPCLRLNQSLRNSLSPSVSLGLGETRLTFKAARWRRVPVWALAAGVIGGPVEWQLLKGFLNCPQVDGWLSGGQWTENFERGLGWVRGSREDSHPDTKVCRWRNDFHSEIEISKEVCELEAVGSGVWKKHWLDGDDGWH